MQNTAGEFRAFADFLHSLGFPVRIGFEPTGNYHRALAYFLHSESFELQLISSLALRRWKPLGLKLQSHLKTDAQESSVLTIS